MVLPAELLTVQYAEPVRRWLLRRFENVHLVLFEHLQFTDVMEKVVLVVAEGEGPSPGAFALHYVEDACDLLDSAPLMALAFRWVMAVSGPTFCYRLVTVSSSVAS